MRASSSFVSVAGGRSKPGSCRKSGSELDEYKPSDLFKLILLKKRNENLSKFSSSTSTTNQQANKCLLRKEFKNRDGKIIRNLDPIPEYPAMPEDEICVDSPQPTLLTLVDQKKSSFKRRPDRTQAKWFNELEKEIVRHSTIFLKKSFVTNRISLRWLPILLSIASITLLISAIVSAVYLIIDDPMQNPIGHALLVASKLSIFVCFSLRIFYVVIKKKRRPSISSLTCFAIFSLSIQFACLAPTLYFGGLIGRCWLDHLWSIELVDTSEKDVSEIQWPIWLFVFELSILLICLVCVNLYFLLIIRHLINLGHSIEKRSRPFLIFSLISFLILQLAALASLFSWALNVSCSSYMPIPEYYGGFLFPRRLSQENKPNLILISLGFMIGLIMPVGFCAFVGMHLENFVALCASILSTADKSYVRTSINEKRAAPDHVLHAAHTYLAWFYENHFFLRYCPLLNATRTMRSRERIRHVLIRFFLTWLWFVCAVSAPIVTAIRSSTHWQIWSDDSGYTKSVFLAPTCVAFLLNIFVNFFVTIVAPVTMVLFACWFVAFLVIQIFYFCMFVLCPNSNPL